MYTIRFSGGKEFTVTSEHASKLREDHPNLDIAKTVADLQAFVNKKSIDPGNVKAFTRKWFEKAISEATPAPKPKTLAEKLLRFWDEKLKRDVAKCPNDPTPLLRYLEVTGEMPGIWNAMGTSETE